MCCTFICIHFNELKKFLETSSLKYGLSRRVLFSFHVFGDFLIMFLFPIWFHCDRKTHSVWLRFFSVVWGLFYGSGHSLSWICQGHSVSWALRTMCNLTLLDRVFYKCQLDPVDWWCGWVLLYPCWFSVKIVLSLAKSGMLKSSAVIAYLSRSLFSSTSFCFLIILQLCCFGACTFRTTMFSWWIDLLNYYIMSLSVTGNFICSVICFIWY